MPRSVGKLMEFGIARESTRGTKETAPDLTVRHTGASFDDEPDTVSDETSAGNLMDAQQTDNILYRGVGDLPHNMRLNDIGWYLLAALGKVSTTGSGIPYTHTFSVLESAQHPSFTGFKFNPADNTTFAYANAVLRSMSIASDVGGYVSVESDWVGKKGESVTKPTFNKDTTAQNILLTHKDVSLEFPSGTAVNVKSVSLNINKDIEESVDLGDETPNDFLTKMISVEGSLEVLVESEVFKNKMRLNQKSSLVLKYGTGTLELAITMPNASVTAYAAPADNDSIITATVSFKASYDTTTNKGIEAVLKNGKTDYN